MPKENYVNTIIQTLVEFRMKLHSIMLKKSYKEGRSHVYGSSEFRTSIKGAYKGRGGKEGVGKL